MNKMNSTNNYPDPGSQRNTWQGRVIWAEENKILRFRSALELIRLMDEALGEGQEIHILAE